MTSENKMERHVTTTLEKFWTESGQGDGQGDGEKKDLQSYRRPYMTGQGIEKEEDPVPCNSTLSTLTNKSILLCDWFAFHSRTLCMTY